MIFHISESLAWQYQLLNKVPTYYYSVFYSKIYYRLGYSGNTKHYRAVCCNLRETVVVFIN